MSREVIRCRLIIVIIELKINFIIVRGCETMKFTSLYLRVQAT